MIRGTVVIFESDATSNNWRIPQQKSSGRVCGGCRRRGYLSFPQPFILKFMLVWVALPFHFLIVVIVVVGLIDYPPHQGVTFLDVHAMMLHPIYLYLHPK